MTYCEQVAADPGAYWFFERAPCSVGSAVSSVATPLAQTAAPVAGQMVAGAQDAASGLAKGLGKLGAKPLIGGMDASGVLAVVGVGIVGGLAADAYLTGGTVTRSLFGGIARGVRRK